MGDVPEAMMTRERKPDPHFADDEELFRRYTFKPRHVPLRYNYPHSEVWAFLDGAHIDLKNEELLDPNAHQRWRQLLVWKTRVAIQSET